MLALALGGTVHELQARMLQSEFTAWVEFYKLFPFDDRHRYHRPSALIAHATNGIEASDAMSWLQPLPAAPGYSEADLRTLAAFGFSPKKKVGKE